MSVRLRKVWGDVRESPARSLLVWLAVAVGCFAVAAVFGARSVLLREIEASFRGSAPASATFWLDAVEPGLVERVKARPGVRDAEPRRLVRARVEVAPGEWYPLRLFAVRDFRDLHIATFHPHRGEWPPRDGEILVEESALPVLRADAGGTLTVRVPSGMTARLRVAGVAHDPGQAPGWQDQVGYAYASAATLAGLGEDGYFDELLITTEGRDSGRAAEVASELASWLESQGKRVERVEVPTNNEHPHADHMQAMLTLFSLFGAMGLVLSGTLAANVLAALMAKQVRIIGVMKSLGATSSQVAGLYLSLVLLLAGTAAAVGIAAGTLAARPLSEFIAGQLNLEVRSWSVSPWVMALEAAFGVGIPLAMAAVPVLGATRRTAREALADAGVLAPSGRMLAVRLGRLVPDRPLALSLRNTFRRPGRLGLTLGALAVGGALLMTALNVYQTLERGLERALDSRGDDIDVRLFRPTAAGSLVERLRRVPGVVEAEAWGVALASIERPGAGSGPAVGTARYTVFAPPSGTLLLKLPAVEGRWPRPDELGAVVANRALFAWEPGLSTGSEFRLRVGGRGTASRVVGVVEDAGPPAFYTTSETFAALAGGPGLAGGARLVVEPGAGGRVASEVESVLVESGSFPTFVMTRDSFRQALREHFLVVLLCLLGAAVSSVAVGGLGLVTSMGLNVLERSREIGIMRAIGATRATVFRLILAEGLAVACLSLVAAMVLSLPLSAGLCWVIGETAFHARLPLVVSPGGVGLWVLASAVLTVAACSLAALRALRPPVRDVLAYE